MGAIDSLLRVLTVLMATSLGPAPAVTDPAGSLRMPILSEAPVAAEPDGLSGVARWQQTGGGSIDPTTEEPLDNGAATGGDAEPLDAPTDTTTATDVEPLDNGTAATQPPSDLPADNRPAPAATTPATTARTTTTPAKPVLPADFGRGETVVLNPPAGETVQMPTGCKRLMQHGRAVIGLNCGTDDGPWWLSQVGALAPAKGRPAHKDGTAVTVPVPGSQAVIINAGRSETETVDALRVGNSRVSVTNPTVRRPGEISELNVRGDHRAGLGPARERVRRAIDNPARRGDRSSDSSQRSSAQETRRFSKSDAKTGKKQRNACTRMKQKAKAGASKKELTKLRHKCQQFRKAKAADR